MLVKEGRQTKRYITCQVVRKPRKKNKASEEKRVPSMGRVVLLHMEWLRKSCDRVTSEQSG